MTDEQLLPRGAPHLLAELADTAADLAQKKGFDSEKAAEFAVELVDWLRVAWGGQPIYFAFGCAIDISREHMRIFEEFNGTNHAELARKYNKSVVHIYRVVKSVKAAEVSKRQKALF